MKNMIVDSIGNLDNDMVESVAALRQTKRNRLGWTKWVAMAACMIMALFVSISVFTDKKGAAPFSIKAYAMDSEDKLVGTTYMIGQVIPMKPFELSTGKDYYLFSIPLSDKKSKSQTRAYSFKGISDAEMQEILDICAEETGRVFFYFIPSEDMMFDECIVEIPLNDTGGDEFNPRYNLKIKYSNGEFSAQIIDY